MYAPINEIQSPDDEDEERDDVVGDCREPIQESFLSYYTHNFGQVQDFTAKSPCADFACFNAVSTPSNPFKISYDRLIQEGFDLASPKKKRKSETAVDGGGGRVVRATGRKDRHSKVRTARGPRDRRVRLSPTTAIQFYDVQDRLGYDRPSKAIDWLIKEAKTAIDALHEQQSTIKFSDSSAAEFSLTQPGMREKQARRNDDSLASGFSCFVDEAAAAPCAAALEASLDQNGFCSALNSTPQILETNWEMATLQKMFTWNSVTESSGNARGGGAGGGAEYSPCNSLPPHAAAQPILGHTNLAREPLQSSININYASSINNDFAGFNFSDELWKITDSAATPKEDEKLKKLIFSTPSTTVHYQD